jgi:hypothetical protein
MLVVFNGGLNDLVIPVFKRAFTDYLSQDCFETVFVITSSLIWSSDLPTATITSSQIGKIGFTASTIGY